MRSVIITLALIPFWTTSSSRENWLASLSSAEIPLAKDDFQETNLNQVITMDSMPGLTALIESHGLCLCQNGKVILRASADPISFPSVNAPTQLDSSSFERDLAGRMALNPPIGDADNCYSTYTVDSVREYKNKYALRMLRIWVTDTTTCEDDEVISSQFQVHFLSASRGPLYYLIYYYDFWPNKQAELVERFLNNIRPAK